MDTSLTEVPYGQAPKSAPGLTHAVPAKEPVSFLAVTGQTLAKEYDKMLAGEIIRMVDAVKVDGGGVKESQTVEKNRIDLLSPQFIEGIGDVLTFGMKKYAAHNWMRGMPMSQIIAAAERHILALKRGEACAADSKLPHELHVATNMMFLHWYLHGPDTSLYSQFDDRVFKSP